MTELKPVNLGAHQRGAPFRLTMTLSGSWTGAMFTGGVFFALRRRPPASSVVDDSDAEVVATADTADGRITFDGTGKELTVYIESASTTFWPTETLHWGVEGVVSGAPEPSYPIAIGTVTITPDIVRRA